MTVPEADWDVYRVGARLPSLDALLTVDAREPIARLQRALSAVALIERAGEPVADAGGSEDARFVGRLLLGLLCRGWPTFSSPDVEAALLGSIDPAAGLTLGAAGPTGQVGWRLDRADGAPTAAWDDAIRRALLRGDRRLGIDEAVLATLTDSAAERDFYRDHLAPLLGQAIGWLELQRPIASMVWEDAPNRARVGSGRVDFALELPGMVGLVRRVIELDGPHHFTRAQRMIDESRDRLLERHGWQTSRVPVATLDDGSRNHLAASVGAIIGRNPFPCSDTEGGAASLGDPCHREATRLILTPHAVSRVQLALCRSLMDGTLTLSAREWIVAVVEREVPCADLALRDWLRGLIHLCRLYDVEFGMERVRLLVAEEHLASFPEPTWVDDDGSAPRVMRERLENRGEVIKIDVGIDVSVGAHPTRRYPTEPLARANLDISRRIVLRTAQRQSGYRVDAWPAPRSVECPLAREESLVYFLRSLFRKEEFRPGQMAIIERTLRREDVIGLLPTGAGKSICFQLPALLSPGLSLVIDPIKSLMQDQVENLEAAGVMDAIQINSDMGAKEREKIEWQFGHGEYRLVFISPERLQIKDFRDRLAATAGTRPVAFVVIDEAHCVSEWGHDFRIAYLNLGRIATEYCGRDGVRPPIVALTGTASESVLRDIQRELAVEGEEALIRPREFARDELRFEIVDVPARRKGHELARLIGTVLPERLGVQPDLLASGACGGIVFCPHINGSLGVQEVAGVIERSRRLPWFAGADSIAADGGRPLVGFYAGEPPKTLELTDAAWTERKARTQRAFKAGGLPLLVATSAFGMGIDKPNIRYTVHYAMAKSVEAFAQEAGRAGRDRKDAICAVLFTDGARATKDGTPPSCADCLERGISVEEAKSRAAAIRPGDDDAALQMYLHGRSYQGVRRESAAVRAFYTTWIAPRLDEKGSPQLAAEITVAETDVRDRIEALLSELMAEEGEAVPADLVGSAAQGERKRDMPTPDPQRLIYRLALLGIVEDYVVRYRPEGNIYTLKAVRLDDQEVVDHLRRYVARYRAAERVRAVEERRHASPLPTAVERCIDTLCWFVYEEIEQRRRQAMENMRTILRESVDGADFARRINKTLSNSALTRDVFGLLRTDDVVAWGEIAVEIAGADSAEHVYYQCGRALEDAPDHPGLLLLVGLALQGSAPERREEVVDRLRYGLRRGRERLSRGEQASLARWVVPELARIAPRSAPVILGQLVREDQDPVLARAVLRSVDAGSLAADPILERMSQRCLLRCIDDRLRAFMAG